ncbi:MULTISPECIES: dipeptide ABC transporter ATP-binding protein [Pseudomonas]|jgi:peptide/nickel transport system ATP-binding protein|uniref:ABC-type dipeptide transporter n=2 Tax=Pseudomonas putida group TaxID=136845 RepID=Q88HY3_PSEPK|nr:MULTISPECIES: ABC transporter ATP-binding protein [Pseudomonas]AAN68827.1 ABC transporter, ATP-binding protein [Pseudomonas putida KT2440]KMU94466.1 ABC transporter ATP-binding protein [Pseudomonas putida]KMY34178.1 ABC transporter ATP-binding protein [Pseudomonas putida]MBP2839168.1 ABC transporter ATP-binding protein [Pseudomonas sp. PNP]MCE0860417.1 ABC transporter ATP-binding protein [Pseudomonas alloputida]
MSQSPLIEVRDLSVSYSFAGQRSQALRQLSFSLVQGETLAVVGESGSGKSTLANALLGLLPGNARIDQGQLWVDGVDMAQASERARRQLRGRTIGLVPQDPMVSLNPTQRIGQQIAEALQLARGRRYPGQEAKVLALLDQVGLDEPALRARQYPHELSGGMRQRVLIAIALAGEPRLIIADEPTSALDVTVQRRILDHLQLLVAERGISLLIITHDLGMACDRADRLLVMKQGEQVEHGSPRQILWGARQPYTRALLDAAPAFVPRRRPAAPRGQTPLLRLSHVGKRFELPGKNEHYTALHDLSLELHAGQTLAIVGESGSGKSTALRIALGLEKPSQGQVVFAGEDVTGYTWSQFRPLRRRIQLVQQNPFAALDPRFTVFDSVVEPLVSFGLLRGEALERKARELITRVQLPVQFLDRLPRELSGGQRQRVAIARALALEPEVLLLDEPVSALDVSVQAQILALLDELQRELGMAYVLVSHDLAVVASMADQVLVLRRGQVVEQGPALQVLSKSASAYTRALIDAIPGHSRSMLPVAI